jgi:hypothetical protein
MPLFEVAIIQKPTRKEAEEGASEKLVFGPVPVVARDQQSAAINAVMDGSKTQMPADTDRSRWEVLVRPFA